MRLCAWLRRAAETLRRWLFPPIPKTLRGPMALELRGERLGRALDADAAPNSGGTLEYFLTGTTTPADVFHDADGDTPWVQPIEADSAGRFPDIYLPNVALKEVQKAANGTTTRTTDPVNRVIGSSDITVTQPGGGIEQSIQYRAAKAR